jgi:hypothetical protein
VTIVNDGSESIVESWAKPDRLAKFVDLTDTS